MITIDDKQYQKAKEILKCIPGGVTKAIVTSLNKSIKGAKGDAAKYVARRYTVNQSYVRDRLAKPRYATYRMLMASIGLTSRPRNLTSFKMNLNDVPRGKGARTLQRNKIRVKVKRGGRTKPFKNHFLIRAKKSGSLLIAKRSGGKTQKESFPIDISFGPAISQMLNHKSVVEKIEAKAQARLEKTFDHEVNRILKGYGK